MTPERIEALKKSAENAGLYITFTASIVLECLSEIERLTAENTRLTQQQGTEGGKDRPKPEDFNDVETGDESQSHYAIALGSYADTLEAENKRLRQQAKDDAITIDQQREHIVDLESQLQANLNPSRTARLEAVAEAAREVKNHAKDSTPTVSVRNLISAISKLDALSAPSPGLGEQEARPTPSSALTKALEDLKRVNKKYLEPRHWKDSVIEGGEAACQITLAIEQAIEALRASHGGEGEKELEKLAAHWESQAIDAAKNED